MRRVTYALIAGFCTAGVALSAHADPVTYTFDTISSVAPNNEVGPAPTLTLTFTVSGPVSFDANSDFADNAQGLPPVTQVTYPFPAALTSFTIAYGSPAAGAGATLASFTSSKAESGTGPGFAGYPIWTFDLTADPTDGMAALSLYFLDALDSYNFDGPPIGSANPAQLSTSAEGMIYFGADFLLTDEPAEYTGILTASTRPLPEPRSAWLLLSGLGALGMLGLIRRRGGVRQAHAWTRGAVATPRQPFAALPRLQPFAAGRYSAAAAILAGRKAGMTSFANRSRSSSWMSRGVPSGVAHTTRSTPG